MRTHSRKRQYAIGICLITTLICSLNFAGASDEKEYPIVRAHWQARIKSGMTQKAIEAGTELIEYFKSKFRPLSHQSYIEKSDQGDILHAFMDYKDDDAYKLALSKIGTDAEWFARRDQWFGQYFSGNFQYVVYKSITAIATENPVADLSEGQEGNIFFTSLNLGSFREILAGEGQSKPVTISGTLKMPKKVDRKVPAVIILHGVGGVTDHYLEVADMLNEMGIAAFVIDSLNSRGIGSSQALLKKLFHSYAIRISDAYAALELLSTHPKIDRNRIAVLGYSHGGRVALFIASEKIHWSYIADDLKFAASIAYYPGCLHQLKDIDFTDAPVLILLAEKDNICPAEFCLGYAQRLKESGADIKAVVYKGAHHMFPVFSEDKTTKLAELPDWSNCGKDDYLFLRKDGKWFSPHTNKTFDEINIMEADCAITGGAVVGGNAKAKIESIKEYQNLLMRVFNIN